TAPFYSLQGGLEEMVTALLARLPAGQVRARQAVSAVRPGAKGFDVTTAAGEQHSSRAVLLAVPPPQAARWMADWAPRISSQLTEIPFVSTAAVYLGYRREQVAHPLDGYGAVVPRRAGLRSAAFSFFSTKFPGRAPEGQVLLRAFLGGARDPQVLDLSDEQMIDTVVREAQPLLGVQGAPLLTRVFRWSQATPQLELGHLDRIAAIEAEIGRIPGLFLTGAGLRSTGIPDGIAEARRAAQAIAVYIQS
ncbi:MAG: protoporphyrinogen oxidase, partial [Vicinamibacteria bacterium]|nr:protoporphyrinogen oxidase [Vicinamibacteria bacterium]